MSRPLHTLGDVVDVHARELLRYLRRLTGNWAAADDLFQETFLRALPAFGRLGPDADHRAWVYRIATNVFLNHRRRERRRPEIALTEQTSPRAPKTDRPDATSSLRGYHEAIGRLPRRQRAAFVQRRVLGWSYAEIAGVMGGTEGAARANVYQAARRLRRELSDGGRPRVSTAPRGGAR